MRDEPYYDFEDPTYCYPGTDVLRNKLGIHDSDELSSAEAGITLLRIMDLARNHVGPECENKEGYMMHYHVYNRATPAHAYYLS